MKASLFHLYEKAIYCLFLLRTTKHKISSTLPSFLVFFFFLRERIDMEHLMYRAYRTKTKAEPKRNKQTMRFLVISILQNLSTFHNSNNSCRTIMDRGIIIWCLMVVLIVQKLIMLRLMIISAFHLTRTSGLNF